MKLLDWKLMVTLLATFAVYMYVIAPMLAPKTTTTTTPTSNGSSTARS
tara:strand:+ start:318 stop:461 length:144 start_codon:yes stop_codon:yes gene_type:complete